MVMLCLIKKIDSQFSSCNLARRTKRPRRYYHHHHLTRRPKRVLSLFIREHDEGETCAGFTSQYPSRQVGRGRERVRGSLATALHTPRPPHIHGFAFGGAADRDLQSERVSSPLPPACLPACLSGHPAPPAHRTSSFLRGTVSQDPFHAGANKSGLARG